jgi:hypothetical protein
MTSELSHLYLVIESRLEGRGVNRHNLKFTTLNTHYKSRLALELKSSLGEREGKTNQMKIKRMNTVICFTEVRFQRTQSPLRMLQRLGLFVGVSNPGGGVPGPTSKLSPRAPAQMGRRETEREGGKQPEGDGR